MCNDSDDSTITADFEDVDRTEEGVDRAFRAFEEFDFHGEQIRRKTTVSLLEDGGVNISQTMNQGTYDSLTLGSRVAEQLLRERTDRDAVYQTRIVHNDAGLNDVARQHFDTPEAAKEYLETYAEERFDAAPDEWRRERSADEKWSMSPKGFDGRAVVMGVPVHASADEPLDGLRQLLAHRNREPEDTTDAKQVLDDALGNGGEN